MYICIYLDNISNQLSSRVLDTCRKSSDILFAKLTIFNTIITMYNCNCKWLICVNFVLIRFIRTTATTQHIEEPRLHPLQLQKTIRYHIPCIWLDTSTINGKFIATHANHRNALLINTLSGLQDGSEGGLFRNYNYDKLLVHKF